MVLCGPLRSFVVLCGPLRYLVRPQKLRSAYHRTNLSGYIFATKARIDNRKKLVKQQYVLQMLPQYGELRPTNGWDRFGSLGHRYKFQRVLRLWQLYCTASSSGRQPNFAAFNRGRHLCSAGRPSGWALAHILVSSCFFLSSFFSSPNLSGRRLDVYDTSTHGVALLRI